MTHDEMIAVIQAHKEGKQIQFNHHRSGDSWGDTNPPLWNFELNNYRAKPEPREFYVSLYDDGSPQAVTLTPFKTPFSDTVIKVREVLEGEDE